MTFVYGRCITVSYRFWASNGKIQHKFTKSSFVAVNMPLFMCNCLLHDCIIAKIQLCVAMYVCMYLSIFHSTRHDWLKLLPTKVHMGIRNSFPITKCVHKIQTKNVTSNRIDKLLKKKKGKVIS